MSLMSCPECKKEISSAARSCPSCGYVLQGQRAVFQFEAYRKRVLTGSLIICVVALPLGVLLRLPYVWVLGILGIIVASAKLARMRGITRE